MYTIGAFSRLAQVPVRTLRYYDAIGLLRPIEVDPRTGYRRYDATQLERLNRILVLKDMGLPLLEIRDLLAEQLSLDTMREIVALLRADLEQRVDRERARLARAAARLDVMESGQGAGSHEIAIRATGPRWVASLCRRIPSHADCAELFDERPPRDPPEAP